MKTRDIVAQLQAELPNHDSRFTDAVGLTSLIAAGTTITAVTIGPHGRSTGDIVTITGALIENPTSLIAVGTTVTGTTSFDHDLTEETGAKVTISGAADSLFNGIFPLASTINRRTFTYELPSVPSGGAGGSPVLEEDRIDGFNGRFVITVVSPTSFTYVVDTAPPGISSLAIAKVHTKPRISRAITLDKVSDAYTKQPVDKFWAFVVAGATEVSNDRNQLNDSVASFMEGTERRLHTIVNFDIVVVFPAADEIAAAEVRDDAEDVAAALYKSLAGFKVPSSLSDETQFLVTPTGHEFGTYTGPVYIHRYRWQVIEDLTGSDTFFEGSRAFKDVKLLFENSFKESIIDINIDLDDQPL